MLACSDQDRGQLEQQVEGLSVAVCGRDVAGQAECVPVSRFAR
ncbi:MULTISPECIES: hypothetical protein [unclassified Saccharopolyspora]|nr:MULTISPECIES: hypothetical protein [unclassified Saccharopolyspora]